MSDNNSKKPEQSTTSEKVITAGKVIGLLGTLIAGLGSLFGGKK